MSPYGATFDAQNDRLRSNVMHTGWRHRAARAREPRDALDLPEQSVKRLYASE